MTQGMYHWYNSEAKGSGEPDKSVESNKPDEIGYKYLFHDLNSIPC